MRTIRILPLVVAAAIGTVVTSRLMLKPAPTRKTEQANYERGAEPATPDLSPPVITEAPVPDPAPAAPVPSISDNAEEMKPDGKRKVVPASTRAKKPNEPLRDPAARVAMSFVGMDPEAEAYWLGAIFDSGLPENEREDLMEDLNEEGLSDHKHPGPQDLPLILNRLTIIEDILPHADEFMVTHLGEAYKDLLNLAEITQGGGVPVR